MSSSADAAGYYFSAAELVTLGKLVNSLGMIGSQIVFRQKRDLYVRAHGNLRKYKKDHEDLLKRLDLLARQSKDESALRLIEDLDVLPEDAMQGLNAARRCLLAVAFLGHCIASSSQPHAEGEMPEQRKPLH